MSTKIRLKIVKLQCDYCAKRSSYYYNRAISFCEKQDYDNAEYCMNVAETYLIKHCGLTARLMGLA
jgi:hypothetical protein